MYGNLYRPNTWSSAIIDNRKFIKPDSLIYEAPPKVIQYDEDSLEKKVGYSYGQPTDVMNDENAFRFNAFGDKAIEILARLAGKNPSGASSAMDSSSSSAADANVLADAEAKEVVENFSSGEAQTCGKDDDGVNICGGTNLFPIMDPRFNLREAAKNMILLEDHLFHYGKRCQDCILKHCLTIEGFLEEGITLDKKRQYNEILNNSLKEFRGIFRDLAEKIRQRTLQDEECCAFAQRVRQIRKPLCQKFATFFD